MKPHMIKGKCIHLYASGFTQCIECGEFAQNWSVQDIEEIDGFLVPVVYRECDACGKQYGLYFAGRNTAEYDPMIALFQLRGRKDDE